MTYRERLEQLLLDSIQKSESCISAGRIMSGVGPSSEETFQEKAYREWESAEDAYTDFLDFIKMNQIHPGDTMPG